MIRRTWRTLSLQNLQCKGESFSFPLGPLGISFIYWPWISSKPVSYPASLLPSRHKSHSFPMSLCCPFTSIPRLTITGLSVLCLVHYCLCPCWFVTLLVILFAFCAYMSDSEAYLIIHSEILYLAASVRETSAATWYFFLFTFPSTLITGRPFPDNFWTFGSHRLKERSIGIEALAYVDDNDLRILCSSRHAVRTVTTVWYNSPRANYGSETFPN